MRARMRTERGVAADNRAKRWKPGRRRARGFPSRTRCSTHFLLCKGFGLFSATAFRSHGPTSSGWFCKAIAGLLQPSFHTITTP